MNEKIQEYLSNAETAFISGNHAVALELCEKAIAEDHSNADAQSGAGRACLVLDRLQEAEQYFQKAVEIDSTNGERYFDLGNIKFGLEKYPESLKNYAKAEQLGCSDDVLKKLYYQIGILSNMSGDTKSALISFEKADSLGVINADTKEMLLKRLQIYIESQDFASAENYAVQLKLLAPNEFRSYQIYFQILIAVGKYKQAENLLTEAEKYSDIESDVLNKVDMCFNKAMIFALKAENEPESFIVHYQSALDVFEEFLKAPDLPQETITTTMISKAEIYLKLEKYDEAMQCVEGITTNDNELLEKMEFLKLTCYLGNEDYGKADSLTEKLKESTVEEYKYFATYAEAFIAKKLADKDDSKKEPAEDIYNNAIAFFKNKAFENPMDMFAIVFRIRLYAENGKFAMAEELIRLLPDALKNDLNKYVSNCRS
jgi:tetratricopeptide (TPR) repeat protein